jgi:signal transduction histidine kinase
MALETAMDESSTRSAEILMELSHAFASTEDPAEARRETLKWVAAAVGSEAAAVRLYLADGQGRLRVAATEGHLVVGRRGTARRHAAFEAKRAVRHDLTRPAGRTVGILPLVCRGESVGVLEVVAPTSALERGWAVLESIAAQAAIVFRNIGLGATSRRRVASLKEVSLLTGKLTRARGPEAAVEVAARFCWETLQVPVAAWLKREDGSAELITAIGLAAGRRAQLRSEFGSLPPTEGEWGSGDGRGRRLATLLGTDAVATAGSNEATLCAGAATAVVGDLLDAVGSLLGQSIDNARRSFRAEQGMRRLDVGLAWAAHELLGPLFGARAAMELTIEDPTAPPIPKFLEASHRELGRLIAELELMLRWAVEGGDLRRKRANLSKLVRETARSVDLQFPEADRVDVSGPMLVPARVSSVHMKSAIGNIIRNALTYSPSGSQVDVSVELRHGAATVSISDRGPGIPPVESGSIFDAFVRGRAGAPQGAGLGLFIARRVVEAHGGSVSVFSNGPGSTFQIRLPAEVSDEVGERAS